MAHCHAACKIYLQPFFWEHIKWVQKRNRGSNSSPNPPLAQALSHHTLTQKGKNGFPTFFLKKNPCCLFFLLFWSNCTEQVWGAVTSAPRIDAQEKLSKQRKKKTISLHKVTTQTCQKTAKKKPLKTRFETPAFLTTLSFPLRHLSK